MGRERTQTADAIIVLGCRPSSAMKRRLDRGIELFQQRAAPLLVLSGGGEGPIAEAERMHHLAVARGLPQAALLIETGSRDTFENARETARMLGSLGLRSVLLVTDRIHLPRATILFRLAGLRVVGGTGVMPPSIKWEARLAVHELAALPRGVSRALLMRIGAKRVSRPRWWRFRSAERCRECRDR
jgi:uncharacterized SAM-binding protein YcdF (DUF218 family)